VSKCACVYVVNFGCIKAIYAHVRVNDAERYVHASFHLFVECACAFVSDRMRTYLSISTQEHYVYERLV
jgi:hypothetical protein